MNPAGEGARLLGLLPAFFLFPACQGGSAIAVGAADGSAVADATALAPAADVGPDLAAPEPTPIDLPPGARFVVSLGGNSPDDNGRTDVSVMFFKGPGDCEQGLCLSSTKINGNVWVNEVPLPLQIADWGVYYASYSIPDPPDGVYRFEVSHNRSILTRTVTVRRVALQMPAGQELHAGDNSINWSPPLPSGEGTSVSLNACGNSTMRAVTAGSATLLFEPTRALPCPGTLFVGYRAKVPVGPPFRDGNIWTTSATSRAVVVTP